MPVKHKLLPANPDSATLLRLAALLVADGEHPHLGINDAEGST